ncbi:hypothetical protein LJC59_03200 [Desulfovibrio sp. OttesenSCG-928-A18]|nr:hypothetical protein [Desulfovibrio sp. OttesenSCG-928-A18]
MQARTLLFFVYAAISMLALAAFMLQCKYIVRSWNKCRNKMKERRRAHEKLLLLLAYLTFNLVLLGSILLAGGGGLFLVYHYAQAAQGVMPPGPHA